MNWQLSTAGWIFLACLVGIIAVVGMMIVAAWFAREQIKPPKSAGMPDLTGNPWAKEDRQLEQLAEAAKKLRGQEPPKTE